jgi:hypothetical protein
MHWLPVYHKTRLRKVLVYNKRPLLYFLYNGRLGLALRIYFRNYKKLISITKDVYIHTKTCTKIRLYMWAYCQMDELSLWITAVTLGIIRFYILKFYILVTECSHVFNMDMKTAVVISLYKTNLLVW